MSTPNLSKDRGAAILGGIGRGLADSPDTGARNLAHLMLALDRGIPVDGSPESVHREAAALQQEVEGWFTKLSDLEQAYLLIDMHVVSGLLTQVIEALMLVASQKARTAARATISFSNAVVDLIHQGKV